MLLAAAAAAGSAAAAEAAAGPNVTVIAGTSAAALGTAREDRLTAAVLELLADLLALWVRLRRAWAVVLTVDGSDVKDPPAGVPIAEADELAVAVVLMSTSVPLNV